MSEERSKKRRQERKEKGERERLKKVEIEKTLGRKKNVEVWKYKE